MDGSENQGYKTRWSWVDLLIAAGVVLFGLYWLGSRGDMHGARKRAVIYRDDVVLETVSLTAGEARRIDLAPHGVAMVVEVQGGRVRVAASDCKQQICVRKGWTGQAHDPIICIPNRVTIEVTGDDPRYDAISR